MKLRKIEINGFGKIVNRSWEFSPNFNLIYGKNEAGKSTLQKSLLAGLYGFFDDGSITASKRATMTSLQPWDANAAFGLSLIFETEDGKAYRAERSFSPKAETNLYDLKTGKVINSNYRSSTQGRIYFAEEILGVSRDVFENSSLVRQSELAALEQSASAITDTLLRLSASGTQESTSTQAQEILETILKEQIGTLRSRNKPLPEAQKRLVVLNSLLSELHAEYQVLQNQMHELAQAEESFVQIQQEKDKAEYLLLLEQKNSIIRQQQAAQQADKDVDVLKTAMAQLEKWAQFPIDTKNRIQKLIIELEKETEDLSTSETKLLALNEQIGALVKHLKNAYQIIGRERNFDSPPQIGHPISLDNIKALNKWLENEISEINHTLKQKEIQLASDNAEINAFDIDDDELLTDKKNLEKAELDHAHAKKSVNELELSFAQAGLPATNWDIALQEAKSLMDKWQDWQSFPIHLRDELLKLSAQYNSLLGSQSIDASTVLALETTLEDIRSGIEANKKIIVDLEKFRNIPHQEKSRVTEIANQIEEARTLVVKKGRKFELANSEYQIFENAILDEKQTSLDFSNLEADDIHRLQQKWQSSSQKLKFAENQYEQALAAWKKVGMSSEEFLRLEAFVRDVESGKRPVPKPRRGCRSLLVFSQAPSENQAPTEITIYSQVRPIYAEYIKAKSEAENDSAQFNMVNDEIRKVLDIPSHDEIEDGIFAKVLKKISLAQKNMAELEHRRQIKDAYEVELKQAEDRLQIVVARLENEIRSFGIDGLNIDELVQGFIWACENKEKLLDKEKELERLQAQAELATQKLSQATKQNQSTYECGVKINDLLEKANISSNLDNLDKGVQDFEQSVLNYQSWLTARKKFDTLKSQIDDWSRQLSRSQNDLSEKEANLFGIRKNIAEKYSSYLKEEFTAQELDRLIFTLRSLKDSRANLEKAHGQIGKSQLYVGDIKRVISDFVEQNEAIQNISQEVIRAIRGTGLNLETDSLPDAIKRFEDACANYEKWTEAQRNYQSAIKAQQTLQSSSSAQIEKEKKALELKLEKILKQHPGFSELTSTDSQGFSKQNYEQISEQVLQARDRVNHLSDAVTRGAKNLRHLAEIDEEIALTQSGIAQLEIYGQALQTASSELDSATREFQKMFAPRLEKMVEQGLEQTTNGRYRQARINPQSLNVQVLSPELNELVDSNQLSTGTRDLIYLVLRVGISQMMSSSGEGLPILLDDPLVEFDEGRQKATIQYLLELSNSTQIFFFTKDPGISSMLKEGDHKKRQFKVIELQ